MRHGTPAFCRAVLPSACRLEAGVAAGRDAGAPRRALIHARNSVARETAVRARCLALDVRAGELRDANRSSSLLFASERQSRKGPAKQNAGENALFGADPRPEQPGKGKL
jgi:hypothetical protein